MQAVVKLMERVNNTQSDLYTRYPELLEKNNKKNIVFVSPFFNKHGLYRMILPALELKESGRYNTLVTYIVPEDYTKTIDDFSIKIIPEVIRWADYMVFQANGQDMESLIMTIKGINPKCKIVLDIDRNYHTLNPNNYASKKFNLDRIRNLEKNIKIVDFTTYPDRATEDFYQKKVGTEITTFILPNLLSPFQFEGVDKNAPRSVDKENKLRVVILADQDDYDDINSFRDTINQVMGSIPQMKLYVLSESLTFMNKNPMRSINYTRVPYGTMADYYKVLWNMNPDVAIIPMKKQAFHRVYYKMLELGAFGIPMVTMNEYPYSFLLTKDQHILLSAQKKTLTANMELLAENEEERLRISKNCKEFIQSRYSFLNDEFANAYTKAFI